ncbi:MAG TPA: hypothetical protein VM536_14415 [Chloroflexia bacterium]|nr:hypothetical protein [Chloroflexia bacterium]
MDDPVLRCTRCARPLDPGATVCPACGQPVENLPPPANPYGTAPISYTDILGGRGPAADHTPPPTSYSPPVAPGNPYAPVPAAPGYPPGYGALVGDPVVLPAPPLARPSNPVMLWIGGGLLVLGLLLCACGSGIALLSTFDTSPNSSPEDLRLGQMVLAGCGLGLLVTLGVPGGVLMYMGRKR